MSETGQTKTYPGHEFWPETRGKLFAAIGQNRLPRQGEYFLYHDETDAGCDPEPLVHLALFDFKVDSFPIMKEVVQ